MKAWRKERGNGRSRTARRAVVDEGIQELAGEEN